VGLALVVVLGGVGMFGISHLGRGEPATVAEGPAMAAAPDVELALADTPSAGAPAATAPVIERTPVVDPHAVQKTAPARAKPAAARRSAVAMYEMATAADDAAVAATARERQQRDYEVAKSKYDASEREEGYRWAQSNRVRVARYCRTTARRTDAFMEGCLAFVGRAPEARSAAGAAPQPAVEVARSDS
jgi:hypothetical protein